MSGQFDVCRLLLRLGASPKQAGFHYAAYGIELAMKEEERMMGITKGLYLETGRHYHVSWGAVECGLRTMISRMWEKDHDCFRAGLDYPGTGKPTAGEFLAVAALYLKQRP
ncbi:MAG: sporulation initiation factor Spo0A C-terminal domain-containing protein [Clostridiales bacterium]|nr:sporulation initiation factor Spo0A C-terminal domain-containing protein [Clostridiales bacterium]